MSDLFGACSIPATRKFLDEYIALCKKHGMVLVPTYEGEVSHHDGLRCVPFDPDAELFTMETSVDVTQFDPPLELFRE
jgi:hypothetical protein